jgi:septin family protein
MSGSDIVPTSEMVSGSDTEAQQNLPRVPSDIKFRVLIIGRANAGKTSILQRVCDTTESPEIYSVDSEGVRTLVRSRLLCHCSSSDLIVSPDSTTRSQPGGRPGQFSLVTADRKDHTCTAWRT